MRFTDQIQNPCEGRDSGEGYFSQQDSQPPLKDFDDIRSSPKTPSSCCPTPQQDCFDPSPSPALQLEEPHQQSIRSSLANSPTTLKPARSRTPSASILHSPTAVSACVDSAREGEKEDVTVRSMSDAERDMASSSESDAVITGSKRRLKSPESLPGRRNYLRQHAPRQSGRYVVLSSSKSISSAASQSSNLLSDGDDNYEHDASSDDDKEETVLARNKRFRRSSSSSSRQSGDCGSITVGVARLQRTTVRSRPTRGRSGTLSSPRRSILDSVAGMSNPQLYSFEMREDGALVFHPQGQKAPPARTVSTVSRRLFTQEEDALLLRLKARETLSWEAIYSKFTKRYPGRTIGSLQVHYSTKLRRRK
ncbi:MAG: hypothetical protein M1828_002168 [Chrysothrix sp. TS-e1954]|nr:MAG: hypothetical protein M1828_002168 [Chrysothrix sp. TS-e1954]